MTKPELQAFIDHHDLAVISTLAADGRPQAAVIEFATTADLKAAPTWLRRSDLNQRPWNIQEMTFS